MQTPVIDSVVPEAKSDSEAQSAITGGLSSGSSSFPEISDSEVEISDSEDDPSMPFPQDSRLRALHIHQGRHQPILSKYKVAIHRAKARSFCSKWYEFYTLPRWTECSASCAVHLLMK